MRSITAENFKYNYKKWKIYKKKIRLKVYRRDKFSCRYCGLDMKELFYLAWLGRIPMEDCPISLDHIIPRTSGHPRRNWHEDNLVTACKPCNLLKADKIIFTPETQSRFTNLIGKL